MSVDRDGGQFVAPPSRLNLFAISTKALIVSPIVLPIFSRQAEAEGEGGQIVVKLMTRRAFADMIKVYAVICTSR